MNLPGPGAYRCSLPEVLAARDARQLRQKRLQSRFDRPVLSLSLVSPGEIKTSDLYELMACEAMKAVSAALADHAIEVLFYRAYFKLAGPEAAWVVDAPAARLKSLMVGLEHSHPLGRLWDIDVVDAEGQILSRRELGLQPRRCLICERDAVVCGRHRSHPVDALLARIKEIAKGWSGVSHV